MSKLGRLMELLQTMDIPEKRRGDFQWLIRNLPIRNSKHEHYQEVMKLLREAIKGE